MAPARCGLRGGLEMPYNRENHGIALHYARGVAGAALLIWGASPGVLGGMNCRTRPHSSSGSKDLVQKAGRRCGAVALAQDVACPGRYPLFSCRLGNLVVLANVRQEGEGATQEVR